MRFLTTAGIEVGNGVEMMELARMIKGQEEIRAMRCAVNACQASMLEMQDVLAPGMTEREVWSILHAGNIRCAGEWIETGTGTDEGPELLIDLPLSLSQE